MLDNRTPEEKKIDRLIGQRAEEAASWYFRLFKSAWSTNIEQVPSKGLISRA
jgi:hypothetical protein